MITCRKKKDIADGVGVVVSGSQCLDEDDEDDFSYRLSEETKKELGEIDLHWFENAVLRADSSMHCRNLATTIQEITKAVSPERICSSQKEELLFKSPDVMTTSLPPYVLGWTPDMQICDRSHVMIADHRECGSGQFKQREDVVHSTPAHIALSLGASMGGHEMSWTSSMATPVTYPNVVGSNIGKRECLDGDSFEMSSDLDEWSRDLTGDGSCDMLRCDSVESLIIAVQSECQSGALGTCENGHGEKPKTALRCEVAEPELKKCADESVPAAETNQIVSCVTKVGSVLDRSDTPNEDGSRISCELSGPTPKLKKSGISKISLPRKRMTEISSSVNDKDEDNRIVNPIDELRRDLRDEFMKDFHSDVTANSTALLEKDLADDLEKNSSSELNMILIDEFNKHPFEFCSDPKTKIKSDHITIESKSIEAVGESHEKSSQFDVSEWNVSSTLPAVKNNSSVVVHQNVQHCDQIAEGLNGSSKRTRISESPLCMERPVDCIAVTCSEHNEQDVAKAVHAIFNAEHDYAKPVMLDPCLSHGDESFSQWEENFSQPDSSLLNVDSQLMEVVDCTTECLESIRNEQHCEPYCEMPATTEGSEDATKSQKRSSKTEVAVFSGNTELNKMALRTAMKSDCLNLQGIDSLSNAVDDSFFSDMDFLKSEHITKLMESVSAPEQPGQFPKALVPAASADCSTSSGGIDAIGDARLPSKVSCAAITTHLNKKDECINETTAEDNSKIKMDGKMQLQVDAVDEKTIVISGAKEEQSEAMTSHLANKAEPLLAEQLNSVLDMKLDGASAGPAIDDDKCIGVPREQKKSNNPLNAVKEHLDSSVSHFANAMRPPFGGFSTATGKPVQVSEHAINEAKARLQVDLDSLMETSNGFAETPGPRPFQGFALASGKAVALSEKALEKAMQLHNQILGDIAREDSLRPAEKCDKLQLDNPAKPFQGFSTASGKKCAISKDALEKARIFIETESAKDPNTRSTLRSDIGGHGVKRPFSSINEKLDEGRNKVLHKCDAVESRSVELSVTGDVRILNTVDVSKDSLDAAEALIAMSNAACWSKPSSKVNSEKSVCASKDVHGVDVTVSEFSSIALPEHVAVTKEHRDDSSHGMTTEVLESTFAFLEDERHDDTSKNNGSCQASVSALNCKGTHLQESKHNGSEIVKMESATIYESKMSTAETRKALIQQQFARICQKSKLKIFPQLGSLYHMKETRKSSGLKLRKLFECGPKSLPFSQAMELGVKRSTLNVRSRNAGEFRFSSPDHFMDSSHVGCVVELEPHSNLILDEQNSAGIEEFYRALLDFPGVDPKLVSIEWVANHYRWIVWKLAAMEVSFPQQFGGQLLRPARVFQELRYRINCEIDCSRRSPLKKIAERDDTPLKTMVLCVADVVRSDPNTVQQADETAPSEMIHLELTDGWYSMKALLDEPLMHLVMSGVIFVGQKIIFHGAEIIGGTEACPPLEVPTNQFLKLNYNCCRRARWHARLDYLSCPRPFPLPLCSFRFDGGLIGLVDVVIARIYPLQFLEKRSDGTSFVCNDKVNELSNQQAEVQKKAFLNKLYEEAEAKVNMDELSQVRKQRFPLKTRSYTADEISALISGEELAEAFQCTTDPDFFESRLTSSQKQALVKYSSVAKETRQTHLQEELLRVVQMKTESECAMERNVVSFLKVRLAGIHPKDVIEKNTALLTIWRPSEELIGLLEEGKCMQIYYLMAERRSTGKELLVKSTKKTQFEEKVDISSDILTEVYRPREFTPLDEIFALSSKPLYGEVDLAGVVLCTSNACLPQHGKFEVVYLANASYDIVGIKFWGGVKAFGLQSLLEPAECVLGYNLQWRGCEKSPIPCLYMIEFSSFTRNPKCQCDKQQLNDLRNSIKDLNVFLETARIKVEKSSVSSPKHCSTPIHNGRPPSKSGPFMALKDNDLPSEISHTKSSDTSHQQTDSALLKMRSLQRYVGWPLQLPVLASPILPSVRSKYRVPLAKTVEPSLK